MAAIELKTMVCGFLGAWRRPALGLGCLAVSAACLGPGAAAAIGARAAPASGAAVNAKPAASSASAVHVSPYVLAMRRHSQEAASAPLKVNPLMQHRPRVPRASGRAQ